MRKQLIYYFYFYKEWCKDDYYIIPEIYLVHIECIKRYGKNFFDKMLFICTYDDPKCKSAEAITGYIYNEFVDYCKNIEIKTEQNYPEYREGLYFYKEIISKLHEFDGLICWGHGKQDFADHKAAIYNWITLCHYINSVQFKKDNIEEKFKDPSKYFYGPILTNTSNGLLYAGSFYWMCANNITNNRQNNYLLVKDYMDWTYDALFKHKLPLDQKNMIQISEYFVNHFPLYNCMHSQNEIFKLYGPIYDKKINKNRYYPSGDMYCYDNNEYIYHQRIYDEHLMKDFEKYKNEIIEKFNIDIKDDKLR